MQNNTSFRIKPAWLAMLFLISCAFPILASLVDESMRQSWMGALDLFFAVSLALSALWLDYKMGRQAKEPERAEAYVLIGKASMVILVVMGVFFLFNEAIDWNVLVVGLAWRAWLLIYALPAWLAFRNAK
jgi:hypothetical protein